MAEDSEPNVEAHFLAQMLDGRDGDLISVSSDDPVAKALTLMISHDFSQLPVMNGPRALKGVISWKTIGKKLSQNVELQQVRECMEEPFTVGLKASPSEVTAAIIKNDYVLVHDKDKIVRGIVTGTDLAEQFQELIEPFLLLEKIEMKLRKLCDDVFDVERLRDACKEDRREKVSGVQDLAFGDYQSLFQLQDNWDRLGFVACKATFDKEMDAARDRRNEIMHFRPSVKGKDKNAPLRRFLRLLEQLGRSSR
jgi:CBS domain-containing protein